MLEDDEKRKYMLRISMPALASRTCFIATPFDPHADDVSDCIANEAVHLSLQPLRTDRKKAHDQFIKDVYEGILGASVVVAVINNPVENRKIGHQLFPNPNVMYELGIAHALGKPVIIVSDEENVERIPADIRGFRWVTSRRNGGFDKDYFKKLIKLELESQLKRPYKHEFWEATIAEIFETDTRLTLNTLLEGFKQAFDYGKLVHENFHSVGSAHISTLSKSTLELTHEAFNESNKKDIYTNPLKDFKTNFELYELYYKKKIYALLTTNSKKTAVTREQISRFSEKITPDKKRYIEDLIGNLKEIQYNIDSFYFDHKRVCDEAIVAIDEKNGEDSSNNTDLYGAVKRLQATCSSIVNHADSYLKNLLSVFLELYKE